MDPLASDVNAGWSDGSTLVHAAVSSPPPAAASPSTFAREPQVYGDPGTSLSSPPPPPPGGAPAPFLRVRIGGIERNRKDLLIRYDASTNLPNFRTHLYRNMQRSYVEFQRFAEQAQLCCPQTIIPALPPSHTSAATDEEDDRLVRIALQRWFSRVCEDPVLQKEDELRSFIESDFGYNPTPSPIARRQTTSGGATHAFTAALSKVVRRGPLDEDDEITAAKVTLERLEPAWQNAANAIYAMGRARRTLAGATADVGAKMIALATDENDVNLATAERKTGRVYEQLSGMAGAQIANDNVVLNDSLAYQAVNARAARDALAQRTQILEDAQSAAKHAINKRRNVERLKASSSINPMKVDDAIAEMEDANALDSQLSSRISAISQNLHASLRVHSRNAHEDIAVALLEHARTSIIFNRQILRELETLKPDLVRTANTVSPTTPAASSLLSQHVTSAAPAPAPAAPVPSVYVAAPGHTTGSSASTPTNAYSSNPSTPGPHHGAHVPHVPSPLAPGSQSMFLPPTSDLSRSSSITSPSVDPLTGAPLAQSMMLPGQRATTPSRPAPRRLDERKAAKLLAGGF